MRLEVGSNPRKRISSDPVHLLHCDITFWLQVWRLCIESRIAVILDMSLYMRCRSELSVTAALLHDVVDDTLEI